MESQNEDPSIPDEDSQLMVTFFERQGYDSEKLDRAHNRQAPNGSHATHEAES